MKDNKFEYNKVIFAFISVLIPSKRKGPLVKYQRIIAYGIWINIACLLLSFVLFINEECLFIFPYLKELLVGIFCSMIVVIVTSVLGFQKTREEMFEVFYDKVFIMAGWYNSLMDSNGHIDTERAARGYDSFKEEKDYYDDVSFKLLWFSKRKAVEYSIVVPNIEILYLNIKQIVENNGEELDGYKNKEILNNIVDNMKVLSEGYYEDKYNMFKQDFWD